MVQWPKDLWPKDFRLPVVSRLNAAMRAGPNRLVVIFGAAAAMLFAVILVSHFGSRPPLESKVAKMASIDATPGGTQGDLVQEKLRRKHDGQEAEKAAKAGGSYTPVIPGGESVAPKGTAAEMDTPVEQAAVAPPPPKVEMEVKPLPAKPVVYTPPAPAPEARVQKVNSTDNGDAANQKQIAHLFDGFGSAPPRTDIVLPATQVMEEGRSQGVDGGGNGKSAGADAGPRKGKLLIPAGRMIYAHTILAVDSDTGGPLVLEADSGPVAGSRMLAEFTKNKGERLVVRVNAIDYRGHEVDCRGLVVAPDTMETSVASDVDERYLERFGLPAAAAFVQGLGQAAAMSGAVTQMNPMYGAQTMYGNLNLQQQMMVGAGAGAMAIGSALQQQTPRGPNVKLGANVSVAVMFLADVIAPVK